MKNQQLLDEMYGDKDNLDENIAPKKVCLQRFDIDFNSISKRARKRNG